VNGQWLNNARQERLKSESSARTVPILGKLKSKFASGKIFRKKQLRKLLWIPMSF
jgi:hypothetical protein